MENFKEMTWEERKEIISRSKEEFLKEIDYEPLYEEIRRVVNDSSIKLTSEITETRNEKYIEIVSEELINKVGIMAAGLKSIKLSTFNSNIAFDENIQKAYWWGSIDFSYQVNDGGTNGIHVLYFNLKNGKYTFWQ